MWKIPVLFWVIVHKSCSERTVRTFDREATGWHADVLLLVRPYACLLHVMLAVPTCTYALPQKERPYETVAGFAILYKSSFQVVGDACQH